MEIGLSFPSRRALALDRTLAWRLALAGLVLVAAAMRTGVAWLRATPNYFPDEYLYSELSRSIASTGDPLVRGGASHFPALLQPLLTAPAWFADDVATAYRLAQAIDATVMALAAIPVYVLARRLALGNGWALAAAAFALVVPDVFYSSFLLAEPVAYPLVLGAVAAGVAALDSPSRRAQLCFLGLAGLATFARVQFVVLPVCFLVAAAFTRRLRVQLPVLGALGVAALAAAAVGPGRGLGYYRGALGVHVDPVAAATSAGRNLFVLALACGWVIVPGALVGFATARSRSERAFAAFAVSLLCALVAQASLFGDTKLAQERYLFYVAPLLALSFAAWAARGFPRAHTAAALGGGLVALAAAVPVAGMASAGNAAHSPFLLAVFRLQRGLGDAGDAAVVVLLGATVLALVAVTASLARRGAAIQLGLAAVACVVVGVTATRFDLANARIVKAVYVPDASWVDRAHIGSTTLLLGPNASKTQALEQLFWNRSLQTVALLPGAQSPDLFGYDVVRVARDGTLSVRGPLAVDGFGSTVRLRGAQPVAASGTYRLWSGPRAGLALDFAGRYADGWLTPAGALRLWPRTRGVVSLSVTLPAAARPISLRFGRADLRLRAGETRTIALPVCGTAPWEARYRASGFGFAGTRPVSVRATAPTFSPRRVMDGCPGHADASPG